LVVAVALGSIAIWMRRPRMEPIEVSQQTTYIITPTRADGWVDYPEAVDWMRRASLDAGGANAAVPLVRALGRDVLPLGVDGAAAGSWNDTEALWRLGQLIARAATTGEYALAAAFWKAALLATVDLAASPATSPELLSTMQAGLGAKLGFPPATEAWMFHRLE